MVQRRRGRGAPQCADSTIGDSNDGEESDTGNANKNGATVYWKRAPRALNNRDVSDTHIGNGVVSCTHASEPVDSRGLHVLILPTCYHHLYMLTKQTRGELVDPVHL